MTYGLTPGLFLENGPAEHAASAAARRPSARFLAWHKLDSERRLKLVESRLRAVANENCDGLPLAL